MPFFKARHRNASYSVVADKINQVIIPMSFDTGAVNTVISLSAYHNKRILLLPVTQKTDHSVALLGDDFISNCTFHHEAQGDIMVTGFDMESYHKGMQDAVSQNEVDRILRIERS